MSWKWDVGESVKRARGRTGRFVGLSSASEEIEFVTPYDGQ